MTFSHRLYNQTSGLGDNLSLTKKLRLQHSFETRGFGRPFTSPQK